MAAPIGRQAGPSSLRGEGSWAWLPTEATPDSSSCPRPPGLQAGEAAPHVGALGEPLAELHARPGPRGRVTWTFGPEQAAAITCPVLWVRGGRSSPPFVEGRQLLHAWFPACQDDDIVGLTHLLQMQAPGAGGRSDRRLPVPPISASVFSADVGSFILRSVGSFSFGLRSDEGRGIGWPRQ